MTSSSGAWMSALAAEIRAEMGRHRRTGDGLHTLDGLARASGIPKVSIERYVNGKREITMSNFAAISAALGVERTEMLSRVERALGSSAGEQPAERWNTDPDYREALASAVRQALVSRATTDPLPLPGVTIDRIIKAEPGIDAERLTLLAKALEVDLNDPLHASQVAGEAEAL